MINRPSILFPALLFIAMGFTSFAYADSISLPVISDENLQNQSFEYTFHDANSYSITMTFDYYIDSKYDVPEIITIPQMDGTLESILLRTEYVSFITPEPLPIPEDLQTHEELTAAKLEEKKAKKQAEFEETVGKLSTCWIGIEGWHAFQDGIEYESPQKFIDSIRHYSKHTKELKLNQAYEACRGIQENTAPLKQWLNYPSIHEGSIPWELDTETDFPGNDRYSLDSPQLKAEEQKAQDFKCSDEGHRQGLCRDYAFAGENRGNPNQHLENKHNLCQYTPAEIDKDMKLCPYQDMKQYQKDNPEYDSQKAHEQLQELLCDTYMPQYQGKQNIPNWLNHCYIDK